MRYPIFRNHAVSTIASVFFACSIIGRIASVSNDCCRETACGHRYGNELSGLLLCGLDLRKNVRIVERTLTDRPCHCRPRTQKAHRKIKVAVRSRPPPMNLSCARCFPSERKHVVRISKPLRQVMKIALTIRRKSMSNVIHIICKQEIVRIHIRYRVASR